MPSRNDTRRSEMAALLRLYESRLPERIRTIRVALADLDAHGWAPEKWEVFYLLVHRLAGSAKMYGFDRIGAAAAELEVASIDFRNGAIPATADAGAQLGTLVDRLAAESARPRSRRAQGSGGREAT